MEPSAEQIASCVAVLEALTPNELEQRELASLKEAGMKLFRRSILKSAFGSEDVQDFLAKRTKHKETLKELKKLNDVVTGAHRRERMQASECGLNEARKKQLELIKAECSEKHNVPRITVVFISSIDLQAATSSSIRLVLNFNSSSSSAAASAQASLHMKGVSSGLGGGHENVDATREASTMDSPLPTKLPPQGDLRRICNVCRGDCTELPRHPFYHQLCPRCGDFNYEKRQQSADMRGMVCVVTGGRVRIGYATVIKLLRAGATVITTTRFPCDAALRYSRELDFEMWGHNLSVVGPLELSDIRLVEAFCDALVARHSRIHVLINNAAQTLTRPAGWYVRMDALEHRAAAALPRAAQATLMAPATLQAPQSTMLQATPARGLLVSNNGGSPSPLAEVSSAAATVAAGAFVSSSNSSSTSSISAATTTAAASISTSTSKACTSLRADGPYQLDKPAVVSLADFPEGQLDESRQPLDLSGINSWSRRLGEVETLEVVQTLAANAAAPFILCSRLAAVLAPREGECGEGGCCSHVINVTAVEGKFSVGKKSHAHPHTNMGKAALNMLTFTSATSFYQQYKILMNSVDTGWVTDMAPGGVGVISARHATHVGPPLDEEDGAARVLDPIFSHLKDPTWRIRGHCFRNFFIAGW